MCYSAKAKQNLKELTKRFHAQVDVDAFEEVFSNRLKGSGAKISKTVEDYFLQSPKTEGEKRIAKLILDYRKQEILKFEKELFTQKKRLNDAQRAIQTKVTKKAENDIRVSTNKIESTKKKLDRLQSTKLSEGDSRIFPGQYAPLVVFEDGKRVIKPFRYLLRPKDQKEDFDRKYNGCYNVRRDSLAEVFWWKSIFGRNHGILVIDSFWENVKLHDYENRNLKKGENPKNLVLQFNPEHLESMIVPCLYDHNTEGKFPLDSFALITDEPNPEVKAVGHDRTPVIMKEEYVDVWLKTDGKDLKSYEQVFHDKQPTHFKNQVAA